MGEWHRPEDLPNFDRERVNWDAASHEQLYEWFAQPKLDGLYGALDGWTSTIVTHVQAAADKIDQAMRSAGVAWEGQAAESMQSATAPLADHALASKDASVAMGDRISLQAMEARQVAMMMPEPKPSPGQVDLTGSAGAEILQKMNDFAVAEFASQEAQNRARDVARSYDSGTDSSVGELPAFDVAPAPTTEVAKVEPGGGMIDSDDYRRDGGLSGGDVSDTSGPVDTAGPGPATSSGPAPGGADPAPRTTDQSATSGQSWTPADGRQPLATGYGPGQTSPDAPRPSGGPGGFGLVTGGPGGSGAPADPRGGGGGTGAGPRNVNAGPGLRGGAPVAGEGSTAGRGTPATPSVRGGAAPGMAPVGAGAGRGKSDEDTERTSPEYLRDYNDEFWDGTPPVAPPVIGEDDDH